MDEKEGFDEWHNETTTTLREENFAKEKIAELKIAN